MTPASVREARLDDLPRLRAIRAASLREAPPLLLDVAVRGVGTVLVAVSERTVGYALVMRDGERVAYLAELAVAPDHRRQGYGSALLSAVLDRVADHDELRLTTRADDHRARSFYESAGFERLEELPDHYAEGDGVVYGRRL